MYTYMYIFITHNISNNYTPPERITFRVKHITDQHNIMYSAYAAATTVLILI